MNAPFGSGRSAPCLALIKAFCPGDLKHFRCCTSSEWAMLTFAGERIVAQYDIPDAASRRRAFELVKLAEGQAGADIPVRGWWFTEVEAVVRGDILHVEGVAVRD